MPAVTCPECRFTSPEGSKFCAGCGVELPDLCPACNTPLVAGGAFCPGCGRKSTEVGAETREGEADAGPGEAHPGQVEAEAGAVEADAGAGEADAGAGGAEPGEPGGAAEAGGAAAEAGGTAAEAEGGRPGGAAERRLVTILFADLVGSTNLGEQVDPEDVADVVNAAFDVMNRAVADAGGHIARLMGDGMLAFFGAPVSHEDDPLRAVRAALAIVRGVEALGAERDEDLQVRVGLDSGLVVVGRVGSDLFSEYTTLGDAANTAARIQSAAEPGQVLISESTARLVRGAVEVQSVGELQLKGKRDPVPAFEVTGGPPALDASARGLPGVASPMVGRDVERARLKTIYDDSVAEGRAAWVTVVGDAGVGKTRLVSAFLDDLVDADADADLLRGRAVAQESGRPYALIRDVLVRRYGAEESQTADEVRHLVGEGLAADMTEVGVLHAERAAADLARLVAPGSDLGTDPVENAGRALGALGQLLAGMAGRRPVVLVLEDLHWADAASLDAVPRLVTVVAARPAIVIANTRPILLHDRPHWGEGEAHHIRVDLPPLSSASVARLVRTLFDGDEVDEELVDFVRERSEGNAYFVEELVDMLQARGAARKQDGHWGLEAAALAETRVPTTLRGMLQARLDTLTPEAKAALQRASVIGRVFWSGAVATLGGDPAVLDRLRGQGLLYARERSAFAGDREFLFRHALLADAAYSSLLRKQRPALHEQVAAWLEAQAGERYPEFAGRIAEHWEASGHTEAAAKHYLAAGTALLATYANADAAKVFARGLAVDPESADLRFELLKGREQALDYIGAREPQASALHDMETLAEARSPEDRSYVAARRSWLAHRTGDNRAAREAAEQAVDLAPDEGAEAFALLLLGNALFFLGEQEAASTVYQRALHAFEALGDERGAAKALLSAGNAAKGLDNDAAERDLTRALAMFEDQDDLRRQASTRTNLGVLYAQSDRLADAEAHFRAALELYRAAGDRVGEAKALANLGLWSEACDDLPTAEDRLRRAVAIQAEVRDRRAQVGHLRDLADIVRRQDREAEADALLEEMARVEADLPAVAD